MTEDELERDLKELISAEDFLDYFRVAYDPSIVQVNRLHILQRFHDYLRQAEERLDRSAARWTLYAECLGRAYDDFVSSDARTEKVFRVFRSPAPSVVQVPLTDLLGGGSDATSL